MFDRLLLSTPVEGVRRVLLTTATLSLHGQSPVRVHVAALAHDALNEAIFDAHLRREARVDGSFAEVAPWGELGDFVEDDDYWGVDPTLSARLNTVR